jgi:DNA primase
MKIPQDIIERIVREADIVEIISEAVPLKRAGTNYKGLCPFHGEKTPSFTVTPHKHIYYCFGCHAGGDVISFIREYEKLDFVEAVGKLAKRLGIEVPKTGEDKARTDAHEAYYKINAYAQWFFRDQFKKAPAVRAYAAGRGLTEATVEAFELGFAPDSFDALLAFFRGKNIPLDKAAELGLVRKHPDSGKVYDFFRNRLMFPIRDRQGRIIGFGGRTLAAKDDGAKYVNSPESPVYHKSHELFGLYQNKKAIATARRAVVVEGYVDVIACAQLSLNTAVAPLGTSLTLDQVKILSRLADDVVLMFDGDVAGQKAAAKSFAICLEAGVHPKVAVLPTELDPGDFVKLPDGAARLQKLTQEASSAMDWLLTATISKTGSQPSDRAKSVKLLLSWIGRLPDPVERAAYRDELQKHFGIGMIATNKDIENTGKIDKTPALDAKLTHDELLLLAYLQKPDEFRDVVWTKIADDFDDTALSELARYFGDFFENQETFDGIPSISGVPTPLQAAFSRILACSGRYGEDLNPRELLAQKARLTRKKRLKDITAKIMQAKLSGDAMQEMRLLAEKQRLLSTMGGDPKE